MAWRDGNRQHGEKAYSWYTNRVCFGLGQIRRGEVSGSSIELGAAVSPLTCSVPTAHNDHCPPAVPSSCMTPA